MSKIFLTKLKDWQWKKTVYFFLTVFYLSAIAIVFVFTVKFLYKNIDYALAPSEQSIQSQLTKIDLDNFYPVAKKLGIDLGDNGGKKSSSTPPKEEIETNAGVKTDTVDKTDLNEEIPATKENVPVTEQLESDQ